MDERSRILRTIKMCLGAEFQAQGVPLEFLDESVDIQCDANGAPVWINSDKHGIHIRVQDVTRLKHHMDRLSEPRPTRSERDRVRNNAFARWLKEEYGRTPTIRDFVDRRRWAEFEAKLHRQHSIASECMRQAEALFMPIKSVTVQDSTTIELNDPNALHQLMKAMQGGQMTVTGTRTGRIPNETEGRNPMPSMTRKELELAREGMLRELAAQEAILQKYEAFPTEEDVLAVGDVIRYEVVRTWDRKVPMKVTMQIGNSTYPPGNYTGEFVSDDSKTETVTQTYAYVAIHVDGKWFRTGSKRREPLSYDELIKLLVDSDVESFEAIPRNTGVRFGKDGEDGAQSADDNMKRAMAHVDKALEETQKARRAVNRDELDVEAEPKAKRTVETRELPDA
jgi:hypothetical protein